MPVPCAVKCGHGIVSADKADAQRALFQYVAHFIVRIQFASSFPYIVAHHERELAGKGGPLVLVADIQLFSDKFRHAVHRLQEQLFGVLFDGLLALVSRCALCFPACFDGKAGQVHCGKRKVSPSQTGLFAVQVFEYTGAASHGGKLVAVSLRVVRIPFLVLVERGV